MNKYLIEGLFGIKGFDISWYGTIVTFGIIIGVLLALNEARRLGYKDDLIFDYIMIALPIGIIGARMYYVILEWESYTINPIKIFAIWEGGLAIYGGIIGGFIVAVIFTRINKFPLFKLIDIAVPSLVLGQVIGRWGNFTNQEAYGKIVTNEALQFFPYAVFIENITQWHQATFFYESIWNLLIVAILLFYKKKALFDGNLMCIYLIGYGTGRFFIEGLRTDSLYLVHGLRASQLLSFVLVLIGVFSLVFYKKVFVKNNSYRGKYMLSK